MRRNTLIPCLTTICGLLAQPILADGPDGKVLYEAKCAICHGRDGIAKPMAKGSGNFNDPAWQKANAQESIEKVIAGGRRRMPKYAGKVTPEVIKAIAAHIKTLVTAK